MHGINFVITINTSFFSITFFPLIFVGWKPVILNVLMQEKSEWKDIRGVFSVTYPVLPRYGGSLEGFLKKYTIWSLIFFPIVINLLTPLEEMILPLKNNLKAIRIFRIRFQRGIVIEVSYSVAQIREFFWLWCCVIKYNRMICICWVAYQKKTANTFDYGFINWMFTLHFARFLDEFLLILVSDMYRTKVAIFL